MNILFFPYNAYASNEGGIARITNTLVNEFRYQGNTVIKVGHRKNDHSVIEDEHQFFLPNANMVYTKENLQFMIDICKKYSIDVLVFQSPVSDMMGFVAALRQNVDIKIISCIHNSILTPIYNQAYVKEYELKKQNKGWVFKLLRITWINKFITLFYIAKYRKRFRDVVSSSDAVTVLCDGQMKELKHMCGYREIKNAYVIPNCLEDINFEKVRKEKIVLWVGAFENSIKRPDLMLKVWDKVWQTHTDWKLFMLGDGPALTEMKLLSDKLSLQNIEFTGRINPKAYFSEASILCVTSTHEAFSMVTLEAMYDGVATMAFDSFTSAKLLIEDGVTGRLIQPFDVDAYAQTLEDLMENKNLLESMGNQAKQKASNYTTKTVYQKWSALFNTIVLKKA